MKLSDQQLQTVLQSWKACHDLMQANVIFVPQICYLDKDGKLHIARVDKDDPEALTNYLVSIELEVSFAILNNFGLIKLEGTQKKCLISKIFYNNAINEVKILLADDQYDFTGDAYEKAITLELTDIEKELVYIFDSPVSKTSVATYPVPKDMSTICNLIYDANTEEDWEKFKSSIDGYFLNTVASDGETILHSLVSKAPAHIIEYVLKKGADPNIANARYQRTPAYYAPNAEIHKLLIKYGLKINHQDNSGWTAAHYMLYVKDVLETHLEAGLDLSLKSAGGRSIVFEVVDQNGIIQQGKTELFRILKKYGAKLDDQDLWGLTPLHLAVMYGFNEAIDYLLHEGNSATIKSIRDFTLPIGNPPIKLASESTVRDLVTLIKDWRESRTGEEKEWLEGSEIRFNKTCRLILNGESLSEINKQSRS